MMGSIICRHDYLSTGSWRVKYAIWNRCFKEIYKMLIDFSADVASASSVDVHLMCQSAARSGASEAAFIERVSTENPKEWVDLAVMRETETTLVFVNVWKTSAGRYLPHSVNIQSTANCHSNKFAIREWRRFDGDFGNSAMFENASVLTTKPSPARLVHVIGAVLFPNQTGTTAVPPSLH